MKITKGFLFKAFICLISLVLISSLSTSTNSIEKNLGKAHPDEDVSQYKVLALNSLIKNNRMEKFDYKILTLTKLEAVFYEAKNPKLPTKEEKTCTKNYLFTQLYYQIQLPCVEKNLVCTIEEFLKEYQGPQFHEIDFTLPKEIISTFGEENGKKRCIILPTDSFDRIAELPFICHPEPKVVLEIQLKISELVRDVYFKNTEMFVDYIPNNDPRGKISGLLRLDGESLKFINSDTKKVSVEIPYNTITPYPYNYSMKDNYPSKDADAEYLNDRCFKVEINGENNDFKTFCVFYPPGDFSKANILKPHRARWLALFYVIKIVRKLHPVLLTSSIEKMALKKESLEVDSTEMIPAVYQFRQTFIVKTFEIESRLKINRKLSDIDLAQLYIKIKEETARDACNDVPLCVKGLLYKIVLSILPLGRLHTKYAMDIMNPYISLYPNRNIKVDNIEDGLGKSLVEEASRLKGAENFFAEEISLPIGGVPDYQSVLEAYKIFFQLRNGGKKFKTIGDIKNCGTNKGIGNNLSRRMALLPLMTDKDFLFDFLGTVGKVAEGSS